MVPGNGEMGGFTVRLPGLTLTTEEGLALTTYSFSAFGISAMASGEPPTDAVLVTALLAVLITDTVPVPALPT